MQLCGPWVVDLSPAGPGPVVTLITKVFGRFNCFWGLGFGLNRETWLEECVTVGVVARHYLKGF